ncbi:MAG TPA: sigma-70 family RNA polymerase sigma factor [Armatimonadota bacterium]
MSDEALMERVIAGDVQALGALFERHKQPLFNFLLRFVRDRALAEDVLLDAFLRLYDRRQAFRRGAAVSTWLYTIAHHLALDRLKRAHRRDIPLDELPQELSASEENLPLEACARNELAQAVRGAIAQLPRDQQAVILLREYQGLSYGEIGTIIGISEEAARVRAHRARLTLRKLLEPAVGAVTFSADGSYNGQLISTEVLDDVR